MRLRLEGRSAKTCPYCRDDLGATGLVECSTCNTRLHRDCYKENSGCTTMGCSTRLESWPQCPYCRRRVEALGAVVCIHCGYDFRRGDFHETLAGPRLAWVAPRWMRYTEEGRRRQGEQDPRRKPRWKGLAIAAVGCLSTSLALNLSGISSLQLLNLLLLPLWALGLLWWVARER